MSKFSDEYILSAIKVLARGNFTATRIAKRFKMSQSYLRDVYNGFERVRLRKEIQKIKDDRFSNKGAGSRLYF